MGKRGPDRTVSDPEIVEEIRSLLSTGDPVVTTSEIEGRLPIGKRAVQNRLRELQKEGEVLRKDVGRASVWWLPKKVGISDVDVPGRVESDKEQRHRAIKAAHELIRDNRRVDTQRLIEAAWQVDNETYASPRSLWNNAVRPGLKQLSDVKPFQRGQWVYVDGADRPDRPEQG